jgi:hypothetical protein
MHDEQLQLQQLLRMRCGERLRVVRDFLLLLYHTVFWLRLC